MSARASCTARSTYPGAAASACRPATSLGSRGGTCATIVAASPGTYVRAAAVARLGAANAANVSAPASPTAPSAITYAFRLPIADHYERDRAADRIVAAMAENAAPQHDFDYVVVGSGFGG